MRFQAAALSALLAAGIPAAGWAESNIDPEKPYAWGENIGWINLRPSAQDGVVVHDTFLSGYAWGENVGWIFFGAGPADTVAYANDGNDHGVNIEPGGGLSGYAWGENIGWIVFDTSAVEASQVAIDTATGEFSGFAWGENVGWINFAHPNGVRYMPDSSVDDWTLMAY